MKVGIKLGKVKKFGIGWCIHHRMAADNAEGGLARPPHAWYRVKKGWIFISNIPDRPDYLLIPYL